MVAVGATDGVGFVLPFQCVGVEPAVLDGWVVLQQRRDIFAAAHPEREGNGGFGMPDLYPKRCSYREIHPFSGLG